VNSILGIDLTESRARLVELERRGNPFNKFKPKFRVLRSFTVEFEPAATPLERIQDLTLSLRKNDVRSKFAVTTVQTLGVKTITAVIPPEVDHIDEWIREHHEKLLKLPIPIDQVSIKYEILQTNGTGILTEITFVRKSDIAEHIDFIRQSGLELLRLGAGYRDAINAIMIDSLSVHKEDLKFVYASQDEAQIASFENGNRRGIERVRFDRGLDAHLTGNNVFVAGEVDKLPGNQSFEVFTPLSLPSEYALSIGLAIKGFLPELSPVNYLDAEISKKTETFIYRSLFQRVALGFGVLTIVLLGMQFLTSSIFQSKIDAIDDLLTASGGTYADVAVLEQQVNNLESRLHGGGASLNRSNLAKALHDIAIAAPDSVWFTKLGVVEQESRRRLSISGYARSNEEIAGFLKQLQLKGNCAEVSLIRSGLASQPESSVPVRRKNAGFVTFEISGIVRD
jgi:Tfp pilus assembly protein PilN